MSFIDLAIGRELGRAETGPMPPEIAVSPDGRQAAVVADGGRSIDLFDVATRAKLRTIDLSPNQGPHGIAWLEDGRIVVTTERSRSLTIVDTRRGDTVSAVATGQEGTHMVAVAASPDGRWMSGCGLRGSPHPLIHLESRRRQPHDHRRPDAPGGARGDGRRHPRGGAGDDPLLPRRPAQLRRRDGRDRIAEVALESGQVLRRFEAGSQRDGLAIAPATARDRPR